MMDPVTLNSLLNISLLALLTTTAIAVVVTRNLLTSTILLSIFSLLMAAMYLVLGAPDVAITEAAVGAGISTMLFLAVLLLTGHTEKRSAHPIMPLIVIILTAAALLYATAGMPDFGDPNAVTNNHIVPHYLNASYGEIGIPNVVTSILANYRGFDTFGEVMVVFTAAMAVWCLLSGTKPTRK